MVVKRWVGVVSVVAPPSDSMWLSNWYWWSVERVEYAGYQTNPFHVKHEKLILQFEETDFFYEPEGANDDKQDSF